MVTATAAGMPHKAASAKPAPFAHRETRISSFSFDRRVAALSFAARIFAAEPGETVPRVEVHYEIPAGGPIAEQFSRERNPEEAFRKDGQVAWNHGGVIHFNGWKMPRRETSRASALVHEMAHILLATNAGRNGQVIRDLLAYESAAEGIATYAEVARLRASGVEWPGFPEGIGDVSTLGFAFFNSICEMVKGAEAAFHLLASNLPISMREIVEPHLYLKRVASERAVLAVA